MHAQLHLLLDHLERVPHRNHCHLRCHTQTTTGILVWYNARGAVAHTVRRVGHTTDN